MDILLHGYCRENILDDGIIILQEIHIMQTLMTPFLMLKSYIFVFCKMLKECPQTTLWPKLGFWSSRGEPGEGNGVETCT